MHARAADIDPVRARWLLAAVMLVALVLRIVYVLQSRSNPYFAAPQMDALYHTQWASAWAQGRDFQPGPFFRAPLYPWFLGLVFKTFGDGLLLPRIVQALLGTLSVGLVYLVGARAFDRRVGLLAALFAAVYWVLIYFDGELQLPSLEVPTYLGAIYLTLRLDDRRSRTMAALAGVAWGIAALVRPNVLLFAPLVAGWIAWRGRASPASWRSVALFLLGIGVPILPITIYNWTVGGDRVLISSQAGVNLWIGNNPHSDGSSAIVPGTRPDWWGGYHDAIQQAEVAEGRSLKPSEVSRHYTRRALRFVFDSPWRALKLTLWKLRLFWTDYELGNNADERFFAHRFGPILRWLPLGFGLVAPLGLIGFLLAWRTALRNFPLWGFVPVYTASVVAFFVCSRYRVPLLPVLMVFAAHTCVHALDAWRKGRHAAVAWMALFTVAGIAFVRHVPAGIDRTDAQGLWQLGVFEAQHSNPAGAAELFRASIAENPRFAFAHHDLGLALVALGRKDEARSSFERALELDPASVPALRGLFYVELDERGPETARIVAERMIRSAPLSPEARYLFGRAVCAQAYQLSRSGASHALVTKHLEEGLHAFRQGIELHPDAEFTFNCAAGAGTALLELGRPDEAAKAFRTALAARTEPDADGWYWSAWTGLVRSLAASGRSGEARQLLLDLSRRFPGDPHLAPLERELDGR